MTTDTAPQTLVALCGAIRAEQASIQQLQREEAEAQDRIKACLSCGENTTAARANLARLQADMTGAAKRIAHLEASIEEVLQRAVSQAYEGDGAPLAAIAELLRRALVASERG